ncbi:MAG: TetR family transcriptional regulator [Crocinitomicaceae bacterium]|nr:TetR family transcriptional regulator [Crocinitomicaceae bacterium]|tara:strand:+ start:2582 stop:3175 length:594 start_codon:yes stop_codon:yes gene_type:complete
MNKGEETREMIIKRSAELFNTLGYNGCSLNEIMEATQLKKGGIYNHFKNKDDIALAAFEYSYSEVLKRFKHYLSKESTSYNKILAIIEVFYSFGANPVVSGGCPIFNTAIDATDVHPELRKRAQDGINTLVKYVEIKIEEGKIEGEFRNSAKAPEFALLLVSTLEGALMISRVNDNTKALRTAADLMKTYLKQNILK